MAYKNWKKNYHARRKGNKWLAEDFCNWWDFGKDWKEHHQDFYPHRRYFYYKGKSRTIQTLADIGWRTKIYLPQINTPIEDLTLYEAEWLSVRYGEIERKKRLAAGGYRNGRKTYFKKVYNHRRRRIGKEYGRLAAEDRLDEADLLNQDKDKHFGWDID